MDIKRLKEGNEKVFEHIVSTFWIRIFKFASIYTINEEVAKEITQDTFISLWKNKSELTDDTCITTYLLVIARNKCLDYLKKKQLDVVSFDEINEEIIYLRHNKDILEDRASDILIAKDLEEAITNSLNKLPEKTRLIFEMSRNQGLMNKEIAEELGISVKTVEFHISKALQQLRNDLKKDYFIMVLIFHMFS